ncbi:MAG: sigma-70 family RNA polymerase sigma factor [Flavihumibacter sp.]
MEAAFSMESWFAHDREGAAPHFAVFYRSCFQPLSKYAVSIVSDQHLAAELVSDVIWRAWKYRGRWETPSTFRAFMFSSVRNAAYNNLLMLRRQEKKKRNLAAAHEWVEERTVLNRMVHKEVVEYLFATAALLPGQCGRVFHLYYREGLSHDEIAAQLSVSASTVRNQKARALRLLRNRIKTSFVF